MNKEEIIDKLKKFLLLSVDNKMKIFAKENKAKISSNKKYIELMYDEGQSCLSDFFDDLEKVISSKGEIVKKKYFASTISDYQYNICFLDYLIKHFGKFKVVAPISRNEKYASVDEDGQLVIVFYFFDYDLYLKVYGYLDFENISVKEVHPKIIKTTIYEEV